MKLFLNKNIYTSPNISVYGISVYCAIGSLLIKDNLKSICTTPEILSYQITKSTQNPRRFNDSISVGLEELISLSYIKKIEEFKKHYILDCSGLYVNTEKDFYTVITLEEVQKIFNIKKVNNSFLLKYFIYLIGTISSSIEVYVDAVQSKTGVVGNLTIDYISKLSGISERSVIDYNKLLEDNGLLYVFRQNDFSISESGEIRQLPNVYGRPSDKKYIDAFAENQKQHKESFRYITKNTEKVNNNRRLAQMYNQLVKLSEKNQEVKYSNGEIQDVYNYVISENRKYESLYDKDGYEKYLDKIRDIDVFDKYDFIERKDIN